MWILNGKLCLFRKDLRNAPVITGFAYYCVTTNSRIPSCRACEVHDHHRHDEDHGYTFVAPLASLLNSEEFPWEGGKPTKDEILSSFVHVIEEQGRSYPAHKNFLRSRIDHYGF